MTPLDEFYQRQQEPLKGVYLALRDIILKQDENITHSLKYGCPFFSYKGKMFCYLWFHKKFKQPYISLVEGMLFEEPFLLQEKRARMKIMLLDMDEDLPIEQIEAIIQKAISFYQSGLIKIK
ncbi:DUF1801 domain-containing protein [Flavobacterium sp. NG2]|uniref:DUF1801 domain-containing protein n=1 Tax=Flavobacterium sp. NG2 TaxID=3097547 RepID=UPI002A8056FB|nr:DUF1801 domain-containing protein [Flavobacterium sp. NG2]WPR72931.1 DUF1801 domain-containing protein [Flavobacterium sp. NG2]